eukprot:scaffold20067_cov107-Isochrysis_galbana.AAC.4
MESFRSGVSATSRAGRLEPISASSIEAPSPAASAAAPGPSAITSQACPTGPAVLAAPDDAASAAEAAACIAALLAALAALRVCAGCCMLHETLALDERPTLGVSTCIRSSPPPASA